MPFPYNVITIHIPCGGIYPLPPRMPRKNDIVRDLFLYFYSKQGIHTLLFLLYTLAYMVLNPYHPRLFYSVYESFSDAPPHDVPAALPQYDDNASAPHGAHIVCLIHGILHYSMPAPSNNSCKYKI